MAITFHQLPKTYVTSDNPISYVFSSNQTTQANFSYIVETIIDGVVVSTDRVFPEVSARSQWDASKVVKTNIYKPERGFDLYAEIELPVVVIRVTENYGDPAINQATANSPDRYVIKAKFEEKVWIPSNLFSTHANKLFSTDIPDRTIYATREQDVFMQILSDATDRELLFEFYNSSDVLQGNYSTGVNQFRLWDINANYGNLISVFPALDSCAYITVTLLGVVNSEIFTIRYIDEDCIQKNVISWINRYGAFDQFVFTHYLENRATTESQFYEKKFGGWRGITYSFNASPYGSIETVKIKNPTGYIVTGWIRKDIQNWLISLYDSIGVMINNTDNIRITTASYIEKTDRFEELINEEITYALTSTKSIML